MSEPAVLVFAGLDPTGAAGIAADIETINQFNVTPLPIITTLTIQNTQSVTSTFAVDADFISRQVSHLQADIGFQVIKIGLLGKSTQIKPLVVLLKSCQTVKVVLDPILKSSSKATFLNTTAVKLLAKELLPLTTVLTPNTAELLTLTGETDEQKAIRSLPCEWVLLTRSDVCESKIEHRLYHQSQLVQRFYYQKLAKQYHGSGCTLSSAISALLARGFDVLGACQAALDYTYQTLLAAKKLGKMQYHPNRRAPKL